MTLIERIFCLLKQQFIKDPVTDMANEYIQEPVERIISECDQCAVETYDKRLYKKSSIFNKRAIVKFKPNICSNYVSGMQEPSWYNALSSMQMSTDTNMEGASSDSNASAGPPVNFVLSKVLGKRLMIRVYKPKYPLNFKMKSNNNKLNCEVTVFEDNATLFKCTGRDTRGKTRWVERKWFNLNKDNPSKHLALMSDSSESSAAISVSNLKKLSKTGRGNRGSIKMNTGHATKFSNWVEYEPRRYRLKEKILDGSASEVTKGSEPSTDSTPLNDTNQPGRRSFSEYVGSKQTKWIQYEPIQEYSKDYFDKTTSNSSYLRLPVQSSLIMTDLSSQDRRRRSFTEQAVPELPTRVVTSSLSKHYRKHHRDSLIVKKHTKDKLKKASHKKTRRHKYKDEIILTIVDYNQY